MVNRSASDDSFLPQNITAEQAWDMMQQNKNIALVDVRTTQETQHEGVIDNQQSNTPTHYIQWRTLPGMEKNPHFIDDLKKHNPDTSTLLLFLCKAGVRSVEAGCTAIENGYQHCFNIIGGTGDASMHMGWKGANLPWGNRL